MAQLTPEIIEFIKKNNRLSFELTEAYKIHRVTLYRWLLDNRNMKLSHPKTINIILKHNPGKIKIVQTTKTPA